MADRKRRISLPQLFVADIDSRAPIEKLLDDVHHQNSQAFRFYCDNLRQRKTNRKKHPFFHFTIPGHPLATFPDDWDGNLPPNYFEAFPYKSSMPKMITQMDNLDRLDPLTSYIAVKNDWKNNIMSLKTIAAKLSCLQKYKVYNEDVVECPKHMVDIAAHLDSDPDRYFDSPYNWYYAGNGNMQIICLDDVDYLLRSEFNYLYLSRFNKEDLTVNCEKLTKFDCGDNINILETIYNNKLIALRTKYQVFILKFIHSEENFAIEKIKAMESSIPFASITFDSHHKNILYVTTVENTLKIVNLDRLKGRTVKLQIKTSFVNNWNTVISSNRGYYSHISRDAVTTYDKRNNKVTHSLNNIGLSLVDEVGCNYISAAKQLEESPFLYFGTNHHLFLIDMRFNTDSKLKAVQRWTHGMQSPPTYMSICNFEYNKELICLCSQWCEDMCVVPNYNYSMNKDCNTPGVSIPYRPPSILHTLSEARQQLQCFDVYNPIENRISATITGSLIIEQGDKFALLMQNSLGDISAHLLYPNHLEGFLVDEGIQHLHEWSQCYKLKRKPFQVTRIVDFTQIWKNLKKMPDEYEIGGNVFIPKSKFNEQEVIDTFKNAEIETSLFDIWNQDKENVEDDQSQVLNTSREQSSQALMMDYSDSE